MIRGFILFLLTIHYSTLAYANEFLRFKEVKIRSEIKAVKLISKKENYLVENYKIAPIDLNDDFINEYVVTLDNPQKCNKNNLCAHYIIAFSNHEPVNIGQFDAHKILISNKKSYGIHDIIVYNDTYNDFQNITARWNPFNFSYKTY
jgi:hypothetical protein